MKKISEEGVILKKKRKKIFAYTARSIARDLIPLWRFEPARIKPE